MYQHIFAYINKFLVFGISMLTLLSFKLLAQTQTQDNDPCGCNAALMNGVYAQINSTQIREAEKDSRQYVEFASYDEYQKANAKGIGGVFEGFGFNANMNEAEYQKHQKKLIEESGDTRREKDYKQILTKWGDPKVLEAWSECKKNCYTFGLHSHFISQDSNRVTVVVRYVPPMGMRNAPEIESQSLTGAKVINRRNVQDGNALPLDYKLASGDNPIQLVRIGKEPISLLLSIPGYFTEEYIPWPVRSPGSLPQGLISAWTAEGNAMDRIGNNTGIIKNVLFGNGRFGQAFEFNGNTKGNVSIPDNQSLDLYQFTVEAWINPAIMSDSTMFIVNKQENYSLLMDPGNKVSIDFFRDGHHSVQSNTICTPNNWHHIVGTYDGKALCIYVNGKLEGSVPDRAAPPPSGHELLIGLRYNDGGTCPFMGKIDEVRIYNRALSAQEIKQLFDGI